MALFNEMQVGRFNRFVQKLLSMKGPPVLPTVSSDLQFVHPIESGLENRNLQGWDSYTDIVTATAAAGQFSASQYRNPANSNVVVVIERAIVQDGTAANGMQLIISHGPVADLPTVISGASAATQIDRRGRPFTTLIVSHDNGGNYTAMPSQGTLYQVTTTATNQLVDFLQAGEQLLLLPGDGLQFTSNTAAHQQTSVLRWKERALEDSERQ